VDLPDAIPPVRPTTDFFAPSFMGYLPSMFYMTPETM